MMRYASAGVLLKIELEHFHHEIHGGVVVIQQEDLEELRTFCLFLRPLGYFITCLPLGPAGGRVDFVKGRAHCAFLFLSPYLAQSPAFCAAIIQVVVRLDVAE